jgi:hypothetical protein
MMQNPLEPAAPYYTPPPVQPTLEQLARREALRRFNRRYVYLPLIIFAILWAIVLAAMLWVSLVGEWFAISTNQETFRPMFSGIADIVVIVLVSLCGLTLLIPIALFGYGYYAVRQRRKRQEAQLPAGMEPLPIMWRIENIVERVRQTTADTLPLVARPVLRSYAIAAYWRTLWN